MWWCCTESCECQWVLSGLWGWLRVLLFPMLQPWSGSGSHYCHLCWWWVRVWVLLFQYSQPWFGPLTGDWLPLVLVMSVSPALSVFSMSRIVQPWVRVSSPALLDFPNIHNHIGLGSTTTTAIAPTTTVLVMSTGHKSCRHYCHHHHHYRSYNRTRNDSVDDSRRRTFFY